MPEQHRTAERFEDALAELEALDGTGAAGRTPAHGPVADHLPTSFDSNPSAKIFPSQ